MTDSIYSVSFCGSEVILSLFPSLTFFRKYVMSIYESKSLLEMGWSVGARDGENEGALLGANEGENDGE